MGAQAVEYDRRQALGADRQLRLIRHGHGLGDILRELVEETSRA